MKKSILSVVGLLGLALGCCHQKADHWAGVCDCDTRTYNCRTGPTGIDAMIVAPKAEALKEMPKEAPKQMP